MASVEISSHRRPASFAADCLTCAWEDRRWEPGGKVIAAAKHHAMRNPGHEVHLHSEAVRVYKAEVVADA